MSEAEAPHFLPVGSLKSHGGQLDNAVFHTSVTVRQCDPDLYWAAPAISHWPNENIFIDRRHTSFSQSEPHTSPTLLLHLLHFPTSQTPAN